MKRFILLCSLVLCFCSFSGHAQTTCPAPTVVNGQMNVSGVFGKQPALCWPNPCPSGQVCTFNIYQAPVVANTVCANAAATKLTNVSTPGWIGTGYTAGQWCYYVTTVMGAAESGPSANYVYIAIGPPAPGSLTGAVQ